MIGYAYQKCYNDNMNLARAAALDKAIKIHFAQKYELERIDNEGSGVYALEWSEDDLTFVASFERWLASKHKTDGELDQWVDFAQRSGVRVVGIKEASPSSLGKYVGYGLAAAAGAGALWLMNRQKPAEEPPPVKPMGEPPADLAKAFQEKTSV